MALYQIGEQVYYGWGTGREKCTVINHFIREVSCGCHSWDEDTYDVQNASGQVFHGVSLDFRNSLTLLL